MCAPGTLWYPARETSFQWEPHWAAKAGGSTMLDTNLKAQTWSRLRRKLFSVRLRPWRHASNRGIAALLCTTLMVCLLCRSKEREPEIVPSGGRNRPRLPWLRKRPARRAPLNVAAAVVGSACTNVATGAELAVDHRGILCACTALAHRPTQVRHKPCPLWVETWLAHRAAGTARRLP